MSKAAPRDRNAPDRNWLDQIPTDDAEAALQFCRALARQLAAETTAVAMEPGEDISNIQARASVQNSPQPELSVVLPVYNEAENIPVLYEQLISILEGENLEFEIIFVDDGSNDESAQKLNDLEVSDKRVVVIELARNFGHQVAITAGLDFARGKAVAVMDADLQDPPEAVPDFVAKWREGYDVVYAIRARRKENWLMRTSYAMYYRLLRGVANVEIPLDAGDFCVMDRRVVDLLKSMPERSRFIRGIRSWIGLKQVGVPFERHARYAGKSKYTFFGLLLLALDGLISFSYVPLRVITFLGFMVSMLSILLAGFYVMVKIQLGLTPPGFATVIVAICFLAGIQLVTLGVIGEYVGRIFEEAKRRPMYVLRRAPGIR
jgi:glycosyltransferase involved in cell wall biosynthesis